MVDAFLAVGGGLLLDVDVADGVPPAPTAVLLLPPAFVDAAVAELFLLEDMLFVSTLLRFCCCFYFSFTITTTRTRQPLILTCTIEGISLYFCLVCFLYTFLLLAVFDYFALNILSFRRRTTSSMDRTLHN